MKKIRWAIWLFPLLWGCEDDALMNPEKLKVEAAITPASAFNSNTGAIDITVSGGEAPYYYFWSNGSTSEDATGLYAGTYTLRLVYGKSGAATYTFQVGQPSQPALNLGANVQQVTKYNGADGQIALNVTGGTPPYTYLWSTGSDAAILRRLRAGTYSVTVTDNSQPNKLITTQNIVVAEPAFVCGVDSVRDVNGFLYATVQLGSQCWTAANLRTRNNPKNPLVEIGGRFCKGANCTNTMGAHYTWEAAMNGATAASGNQKVQGICPTGWHLPTRDMWGQLASYLAVSGNGGTGTNVPTKLRGADSPSGFDALYAGNFGYDVFTGENAVFWTASENPDDANRAWYRLVNDLPIFSQGHEDKRNGLSVRCIKD